ncbi:uncharacterized protein DNG_02028 [Cephalotrichum gorgonifer]|uniref:Uncharacterized protein n=1 Tax=Cephalotrichum gorgonifer TaxID=2041049 RepID=A0AAE8MSA2_9PEZI|nr:uncharacterized protein DNG_02028 [Cephalotrichum gorgonifer]
MAPAPRNRGRVLLSDISSNFVLSSEALAMDNRRAQNDILDIIIGQGGKSTPRKTYVHDEIDKQDACAGQGPPFTPGWSLHLLNFPLNFNGHCSRRPHVCIKCLQLHISFDTQAVRQIPDKVFCLSLRDHQYVLMPEEFRACLAPSVRESYDWAWMNSKLVASPGFVWCSEPGCVRGQVCEEGSDTSRCEGCGGELYAQPWSVQQWVDDA